MKPALPSAPPTRHWTPRAVATAPAVSGEPALASTDTSITHADTAPPLRKDLAVWLVVAAFSPYLVKSLGIRLEQLVIYGFGMLGAFRLVTSRKRIPSDVLPIISFFGLAAVWSLLVTFASADNDSEALRIVADVDHYFRPLLVVLGVLGWIGADRQHWARTTLRRVSLLLLVLLSLNAIVVAVSLFADVNAIVGPFRPDNTSGLNVAELAAQLGRYTGIFNLPFEAGVAYSLGLLAWAYLFLGQGAMQPYATAHVGLGLMVVGGLLPVSKVFLLGGLPMFVIYWLASGGVARLASVRTLFAVAVSIVGLTLVIANWSGSDFIGGQYRKIVNGEDGLVSSLSAGRFGDGGVVSDPFGSTITEAPMTGLGLGRFRVLDSAYFMIFVHGGLIPLVFYLGLLYWLGWVGVRHASLSREGRILVLLAVLMLGAGFGAPVASVVRASTVLWTMITLLLIIVSQNPHATQPADENGRLRA